MNCADFEDRLDELFDASSAAMDARFGDSLPADVAGHARECESCRGLLEKFHLLADCLIAWREQIPAVDLTDAVMRAQRTPTACADRLPRPVRTSRSSQIPANDGASRERWRFGFRAQHSLWIVPASLATAAVFMLVVRPAGLVPLPDQPPVADRSHLAPRTERSMEIATSFDIASGGRPDASAHEPVPAFDPTRVAYDDLAQRAAGALDEVAMFMLAPGPTGGPDSEPTLEQGAGWINGLTRRLKPIGRSIDGAFDFLWQAGQSADPSKT